MNICFKIKRAFIRYFPCELFRLLLGVAVPFERKSYFSDYFRLWNVGVEDGENGPNDDRDNDRRRHCLWRQVNAMLGYTLVLLCAQFNLDLMRNRITNVTMWRMAFCDITHHILSPDPEMKFAFALLIVLTFYFNYRTYRKTELRFWHLYDIVLFRRAGWRRFFPARRYLGVPIRRFVRFVPLTIVNVFQVFVLAYCIPICTIILPKFVYILSAHLSANRHRFGVITRIAFGSIFFTNFAIQILSMLVYGHFCIQLATLGIVSFLAIYVRISQNQRPLRRRCLSKRRIDRFERYNVGSIELLSMANRVFAKTYFAFFVCSIPVNVYFVNGITSNRFDRSMDAVIEIYALIGHQVFAIFGIHFFIAQISKRFHRSGRLLSVLYARNQLVDWSRRRVLCSARFALRVSLLIARLHVKRRYGLLYGRIALVSMPLFVKFVLFYGEFWMFLHQQIRRHH